jgi:hypothetical protein
MSAAVVILLTVLWAAILVPGSLRRRVHRSPLASVHAFERSMVALASGVRGQGMPGSGSVPRRHAPGTPMTGSSTAQRGDVAGRLARRRQVLARRRAVLQGLVAAVSTTGALSLLVGGTLVWAFAAALAALITYVGVLVHLRTTAEQALRTVHRLPVRPAASATKARRGGLLPQQVAVADGRA